MGLKDGLPDLEIHATTVSGTTLQFNDAQLGDGAIGNAELADSAASGAKVSLEYPVAYTGSPSAGNIAMQYGAATATDVAVSVSFGTEFAASPNVLLTPAESGTHATEAYVGGTSAGSFSFVGQSGLSYTYFAAGSGRV